MTNVTRLPRIRCVVPPVDRIADLEAQVARLSASLQLLEARFRAELISLRVKVEGHQMDLTGPLPTLRQLALEIALQSGLTVDDLLSSSRAHQISHSRQDLMRKAFDAGQSVRGIAAFLGQDRTTVSHGIAASRRRLAAQKEAAHG